MPDTESAEIHIIIRPDSNLELSTSLALPELYLTLGTIQDMIVRGELNPENL